MKLEPVVRKYVSLLEEIQHDGGPATSTPIRRGAYAAVIANPYAGIFEPDLMPWMEALRPLAEDMARRLLRDLRLEASQVTAFGKGGLVGVDGEHEHAAAWHAPGGGGMKAVLGAKGFVTAGQGMGAVGAHLHIPLVYINSPWVRSHFDAVDLSIADAPRPKEIVFALAMSTGGRAHGRLGGLTAAQAEAGQGPKF